MSARTVFLILAVLAIVSALVASISGVLAKSRAYSPPRSPAPGLVSLNQSGG